MVYSNGSVNITAVLARARDLEYQLVKEFFLNQGVRPLHVVTISLKPTLNQVFLSTF